MVTTALVLFALLSIDPPAEQGPVACRQAPTASSELSPPHDAAGDLFLREVAAEDLEEEGEDEALPSGPCLVIGEVGPPPYLTDSQQSPLHPFRASRHRPLRGPPRP
jgi:hypothetical protein